MKYKDLSVIASVITGIFGIYTLVTWETLSLSYPDWGIVAMISIYLGYAWSSYSRSTNHEKSKKVCLYISSTIVILLLLAKKFDVDLAFWVALFILDLKLRYAEI